MAGLDRTELQNGASEGPAAFRALLAERLKRQGVEPHEMPGFLREMAKLLSADPDLPPAAANQRLHYLGWTDVAVDYQSLQLAAACLQEERGFKGSRGQGVE
jgi:hypothetical protein